MGSCGALSFVFNKGKDLNVTTLNIKLNGQSTVTNLSRNLPNQDAETVSHEGKCLYCMMHCEIFMLFKYF